MRHTQVPQSHTVLYTVRKPNNLQNPETNSSDRLKSFLGPVPTLLILGSNSGSDSISSALPTRKRKRRRFEKKQWLGVEKKGFSRSPPSGARPGSNAEKEKGEFFSPRFGKAEKRFQSSPLPPPSPFPHLEFRARLSWKRRRRRRRFFSFSFSTTSPPPLPSCFKEAEQRHTLTPIISVHLL